MVNVSPSPSPHIHSPNVPPADVISDVISKSGHHPGPSDHVHSEESLRHIINRLSRLEGHIRGVKTMVQEHRPCPDVLIQVAAVRGGLDKVARMILDEHLSECISRAVEEGNIEEEVEALQKALDRFIS
ncbi:MAG: metal-sensing transcriptional repressor [Phormidesmis sp.]